MGRIVRHHKKDETSSLPSCGPTRTEAGTHVERGQSSSLLCLIFCKNRGLISYKRAFITTFPFTHLLKDRTLFLIEEAHNGVRFLMSRGLCNPEALI
jgi:hypothetical protein